ncbi:uncharacterized protein [Branchiostoma lanceolatum]|uniref:uncharacterized protein isoform X2 n=1 Tax=Branchiostoma lanceolatum TaxID=7740 RepID=UPI00345165FA
MFLKLPDPKWLYVLWGETGHVCDAAKLVVPTGKTKRDIAKVGETVVVEDLDGRHEGTVLYSTTGDYSDASAFALAYDKKLDCKKKPKRKAAGAKRAATSAEGNNKKAAGAKRAATSAEGNNKASKETTKKKKKPKTPEEINIAKHRQDTMNSSAEELLGLMNPGAVNKPEKTLGPQPEAPGDAQPEAPGNAQPEAPGHTQPEAPKDAQPEAPGDAQPEAPGNAQPEAPGHTQSEAPRDAQPEAPGHTQPEAPGNAQPEAPGDVQSEVPGDAQSEAPGHVQPEVPGDAQSEAPGHAQPEAPGRVQPEAPGRVQPEAPRHVQPEAPGRVQPEAPRHVQPGVPRHVQPGVLGHVQPGVLGHVQPGVPRHVQPGVPRHVQPEAPGHVQPGVPRHVQPGVPRHVQPEAPRHVQPGVPRHVQPGVLGHVQPGVPRHVQPGVPRHVQPEAPGHVQPGVLGRVQPGVPRNVQPEAPGDGQELFQQEASLEDPPLPPPQTGLPPIPIESPIHTRHPLTTPHQFRAHPQYHEPRPLQFSPPAPPNFPSRPPLMNISNTQGRVKYPLQSPLSTVQSPVPLGTGNLGVVIFPSQLLNAELTTGGSPTAYARKLVDLYFTKEVLAVSSYKGTGKYGALDEDIMAAIKSATIIKFPDCQGRHSVPFSLIVNNKCTKARKYFKNQKERPRCFPDDTL